MLLANGQNLPAQCPKKVDIVQVQKSPKVSLEDMLNGRAAKNPIIKVCKDTTIRIRCKASILDKENYPLLILNDNLVKVDSLNTINPNDIESMQVIKAPESTILYGARGVNGAIIIATKKPKVKTQKSKTTYL